MPHLDQIDQFCVSSEVRWSGGSGSSKITADSKPNFQWLSKVVRRASGVFQPYGERSNRISWLMRVEIQRFFEEDFIAFHRAFPDSPNGK